MKKNNSQQAAEIMERAMAELSKLKYDSSVNWAEDIDTTKEHLQYAIDHITDDTHASDSLIHPENQL